MLKSFCLFPVMLIATHGIALTQGAGVPVASTTVDVSENGQCAAGNPQYVLANRDATEVNEIICADKRGKGTASREFFSIKVLPNSRKVLGCRYQNGYTERFTVHWAGTPQDIPPQNITAPKSALVVSNLGASWTMLNKNFFKKLAVQFLEGNQTSFLILEPAGPPLKAPVILPFQPTIQSVSYVVPYLDSASCLSPQDHYPEPIPAER